MLELLSLIGGNLYLKLKSNTIKEKQIIIYKLKN